MGIANVFTALEHGVRTIDASVAGLGGCPYAPGATGNVATEDVLYALEGSQYSVKGTAKGGISLEEMIRIGLWISKQLGRETVSRVGRAYRSTTLNSEMKNSILLAKVAKLAEAS